jgi:predicted O-methyltransferase YrrM
VALFNSPSTPKPIQKIRVVSVSRDVPDLVTAIIEDPDFQNCVSFFASNSSIQNALVSPDFQALMFSMVSILKPEHVIEIGTYKASTSEAIARALRGNQFGMLHTIDPFGSKTVPPIIKLWPQELKNHLSFTVEDSMSLFGRLAKETWRPSIVFIDGNHDYEFALFDILSSARFIEPGGYIVVDNIGQPGPALALEDFLATNSNWLQLGKPPAIGKISFPFDRERTRIHNTDAAIIKAPSVVQIGKRPYTSGAIAFDGDVYRGLSIDIQKPATGRLDVQAIFRQFSGIPSENTVERSINIESAVGHRIVEIKSPPNWTPTLTNSIETWLTWHGSEPLELGGHPENA